MKIPEQFIVRLQRGREREIQAMAHLGIALAEFEMHKNRLLKQVEGDRKLQDDAVRNGLLALGLNTEGHEHHYHVLADGTVQELLNGEYVDVKEEAAA